MGSHAVQTALLGALLLYADVDAYLLALLKKNLSNQVNTWLITHDSTVGSAKSITSTKRLQSHPFDLKVTSRELLHCQRLVQSPLVEA